AWLPCHTILEEILLSGSSCVATGQRPDTVSHFRACTRKSPLRVRFQANRTSSRHRRMTESDPEQTSRGVRGGLFFVQLYRWLPSTLRAVTIVRPESLVRWLFRLLTPTADQPIKVCT